MTGFSPKLIRYRYIGIIPDTDITVLGPEYPQSFLEEKFKEECNELTQSGFSDVSEFADVLEVMLALAQRHGISLHDILDSRVIKLVSKGGFNKGVILNKAQDDR
mgnify:CR=1 FL=1